MAAPTLDWSSAEVRDSTLRLAVAGDRPPGWRKSFDRTVRLLGSGDWPEVSVRKGVIRVSGLAPGQEERLRHFLESVLEQANAAHPAADDAEAGHDGGEQPPGPDATMTARFRSFAG